LIGFADSFKIPVGDTHAHKQLWDLVAVLGTSATGESDAGLPDRSKRVRYRLLGASTAAENDSRATEISRAVRRWGRDNFARFPWRAEANDWLSLVTEVLLQRTRASTVARSYRAITQQFPTPESLGAASDAELDAVLGHLGLRWRFPLLRNLAQEIARRQRRVPHEYDELLALPGIGPYAASAYLSLHMNRRAVLIDANIVRWLCRLLGRSMDGETRREPWVRKLADRITPRRAFRDFNYAALDFTMSICGQTPRCHMCPLVPYCRTGQRRLRCSLQSGTEGREIP